LEDLRKLNRLERKDEKPFGVVAEVSMINEKAYQLFGRPLVKSMVNETTAEFGRKLHPLRVQHWFFSDLNPMMRPISAMASAVRNSRKGVSEDNPYRRGEKIWSDIITASLDFYRDLRDASSEARFFQIYGSMLALGASGDVKLGSQPEAQPDPRELPFVKEALAAIENGGYPEAVARIGALVGQFAERIPLVRLEMADKFVRSDKVLSRLSEGEIRRLRSEASVLVLLEPERTLRSLPLLLSRKEDRVRILEILKLGQSKIDLTEEQRDMVAKITAILAEKAPQERKVKSPKKKSGKR